MVVDAGRSAPAVPCGRVLIRWARRVFAPERRFSAAAWTVCQSDRSVIWAVSCLVVLIWRLREGVGASGFGVSSERSVRWSVSGMRSG